MHLLNSRQRVTAASLLKRRPEAPPETRAILDDEAYRLWYDLVCGEMQRLGVVDPRQVREFFDRAGAPTNDGTEEQPVCSAA